MMSGNYTTIDNQNSSGSVPSVPDPPGQVSVKFNESTLQTFPPSTPAAAAAGRISGTSGPPRDTEPGRLTIGDMLLYYSVVYLYFGAFVCYYLFFEEMTTQLYVLLCTGSISNQIFGASGQRPPPRWFKVFSIAAYQPYFDVDTADILERIKDSLFPFQGTFNEKTASSPDLYGPFWICTTLIFVSASIGTCVTYLARKLHHLEWDYDIHLLTWSASVLYGYAVVVPVSLYIILKYLSVPLGLAQLICLYGYSLFIFIPAVFLSLIPVEAIRWVVTGVSGFMSAMFVASNLKTHIVSAGEKWFWIVAGIFLLQLALSIVLKLYLFSVST